ncbi:MAG: restriction endonuclease subunit S [Anaerolineae bacterium]|nr:restriction endonuclease subunit S [Anaerolineae bacterium]
MSERTLPTNWTWTTIGEVADTTSGGTPSRKRPDYYGGSIPWIKSGELRDGFINSVDEFITEEALKNSSAKIFPEGTAVVALYGATVGRTGILGLDAATNQAVCAIFPRQNAFTAKFITYWLKYQRKDLIDLSVGGAQPNISQGIIKSYPVPLPPLAEQHRIVAEIEKQLTRLDAGVAALQRAQTRLQRYKAAVLKAACEGRLVAQDPTDEPAAVLLDRILTERREQWNGKGKYKEPQPPDIDDLPELPDGWVWASAEQLSDEMRSITYGVIKLGKAVEDGVPTLRSSDVRHLRLELDHVKQISREIADNYQRTYLNGGEILVTVRGTLGGVVVAPKSCKGFNISREVAMIALIEPLIGPAIAYFIGSKPIQNWLLRRTRGIAYTGINIATLKETPIPLPPLAEQQRIVAEVERRLSVVEGVEATLAANLKRAERLRQSILKQAFEGRLVAQDPADEPASLLLERIRAAKAGGQKQQLGLPEV